MNKSLALIISILGFMAVSAKADLNGSTFALTSPVSFYAASADVTINQVAVSSVNFSTLIISNAAASGINIYWAAAGHAIGVETTNHIMLPAGAVAQVSVNALSSSLLTYTTQLEYVMPALPSTNTVTPPPIANNDIVPELLYYRMTEGFGPSNPPIFLADSSLHGGTLGTVSSCCGIPWVANVASQPKTAIHFNGANTMVDTGNSTLFNFTTNLFTINIWVRPLVLSTQPVPIGNGSYLGTGWYVFLSPIGAVGIAANSPGGSTYVATPNPAVSPTVWTMLTFVRTSTTGVSIYANGVLQPTIGSFADPASCSDSLLLGAYHPFSLILDGDIGVTRIYNRPLAQSEITTLYTNAVSGLVP